MAGGGGAEGVVAPAVPGIAQSLVSSYFALLARTEVWTCIVCGFFPLYLRAFHGEGPSSPVVICLFQMMYLIRGSRDAISTFAITPASHPLFGSCVMSRAVTTPVEPSFTCGL
jgi:hypothetical protein